MRALSTASLFALLTISFSVVNKPALAEMKAAEVIAKLGLIESEMPVRDMPGWVKPGAVIVRTDGPDRMAWFREKIPSDVVLIPAKNGREAAQAAAKNADSVRAAVGFCSARIIKAGPNIHWLQVSFAGVAQCVSIPEVAQGGRLITNMQRLAGPQIAEHVMAMVFYFARGLDHYAAEQSKKNWDRFAVPPNQLWSLNSKTMLVTGLGGIGTQTARLASGLGMRVIATRNSSREGPSFVDYVGLSDELPELISQANVVVNALPLTDTTRNLFDAALFSRMKPSALFINVGRGGSVVTDDLIAALKNNSIAGAGLDVQEPEPVPPEHPLWEAPNLLITPHMSSFNDAGRDMFWVVLRENLRRYVNGERMLSVVDIDAGY